MKDFYINQKKQYLTLNSSILKELWWDGEEVGL